MSTDWLTESGQHVRMPLRNPSLIHQLHAVEKKDATIEIFFLCIFQAFTAESFALAMHVTRTAHRQFQLCCLHQNCVVHKT
jgi:hypothetical protein